MATFCSMALILFCFLLTLPCTVFVSALGKETTDSEQSSFNSSLSVQRPWWYPDDFSAIYTVGHGYPLFDRKELSLVFVHAMKDLALKDYTARTRITRFEYRGAPSITISVRTAENVQLQIRQVMLAMYLCIENILRGPANNQAGECDFGHGRPKIRRLLGTLFFITRPMTVSSAKSNPYQSCQISSVGGPLNPAAGAGNVTSMPVQTRSQSNDTVKVACSKEDAEISVRAFNDTDFSLNKEEDSDDVLIGDFGASRYELTLLPFTLAVTFLNLAASKTHNNDPYLTPRTFQYNGDFRLVVSRITQSLIPTFEYVIRGLVMVQRGVFELGNYHQFTLLLTRNDQQVIRGVFEPVPGHPASNRPVSKPLAIATVPAATS